MLLACQKAHGREQSRGEPGQAGLLGNKILQKVIAATRADQNLGCSGGLQKRGDRYGAGTVKWFNDAKLGLD